MQAGSLNNSLFLVHNHSNRENESSSIFRNTLSNNLTTFVPVNHNNNSILVEGDPFNASVIMREGGGQYLTLRMRKMKEILTKIEKFKLSSPNSAKLLSYINNRIDSNRALYFNFLSETDPLTFKVIIQILYEEVENLANQVEYTQMNSNNHLEEYNKKLEDKQLLCNRLTDDVVEQNIMIQRLRAMLEGLELKFSRSGSFFSECRSFLQSILFDMKRADFTSNFDSYFREINKRGNVLIEQITKIDQDLKGSQNQDAINLNISLNKGDLAQELENIVNSGSTTRGERSYMQYCQDLLAQINIIEAENKRMTTLLADKEHQASDNEKLKVDIKNLNDDLRKLKSLNKKLENDNGKLREQISQTKNEFAGLSNQVLRSQGDRDNQTRSVIEENDRLRRQLHSLNEDLLELESKHEEHSNELEKELR